MRTAWASSSWTTRRPGYPGRRAGPAHDQPATTFLSLPLEGPLADLVALVLCDPPCIAQNPRARDDAGHGGWEGPGDGSGTEIRDSEDLVQGHAHIDLSTSDFVKPLCELSAFPVRIHPILGMSGLGIEYAGESMKAEKLASFEPERTGRSQSCRSSRPF